MAMLRLLLIVVALFAATLPGRAAEKVDLLLVLAADVSRSVDSTKFQLQRDGYAAAITDQRVLNAIMSGANSRIAICFVRSLNSRSFTRQIQHNPKSKIENPKFPPSRILPHPPLPFTPTSNELSVIVGGVDPGGRVGD